MERHRIHVEYQPTSEAEPIRIEHHRSRPEIEAEGPEFLETARRELEQVAESEPLPSRELLPTPPPSRVRITPKDKAQAYQQTIRVIQRGLPPLSRTFSKIIHQQSVERLSELTERSLARPSALLGGALLSSLGLATMLYFARRNGFALSGSELLLFLAVGWSLGFGVELALSRLRLRR